MSVLVAYIQGDYSSASYLHLILCHFPSEASHRLDEHRNVILDYEFRNKQSTGICSFYAAEASFAIIICELFNYRFHIRAFLESCSPIEINIYEIMQEEFSIKTIVFLGFYTLQYFFCCFWCAIGMKNLK